MAGVAIPIILYTWQCIVRHLQYLELVVRTPARPDTDIMNFTVGYHEFRWYC